MVNFPWNLSSADALGGLKTYPRNTQYIIRIVQFRSCPGCNQDQISHPGHHDISDNDSNDALNPALLPQTLALLCLDKVGMLWFEV